MRYIRANPDVATQASSAIAQGKPALKVAQRVWQYAQKSPVAPSAGQDLSLPQSQTQVSSSHTPAIQPESGSDYARGIVQEGLSGLTLGLGPKLVAGTRALLPEALGGTKGFDYSGALQDEKSSMQSFEQQHPKTATALNIAGSILPVAATGGLAGAGEGVPLTARLLNAAGQGLKYGAAQGALSGDTPTESLTGAVRGGAVGAISGPLLQAGGEVVGGVGKALGIPELVSKGATTVSGWLPTDSPIGSMLERVGVATGKTGAANATISKRLTWTGETPEGIMSKIAGQSNTPGDVAAPDASPEMLADLNPELRSLTKAVTKTPGPGRAQILQAIAERNAGTRQRLLQALGVTARAPADNTVLESMIRDRDASANDLFSKAYASGAPVDDPVVGQLLQRPTFSKAYQMAQTMAKDEGRELPTKDVTTLTPMAKALVAQAQPADRPGLEAKLMQNPQTAVPTKVPVPDIQTVAYVDRALRRMINGGFEGNSPIVDPGHANALLDAFGQFRDHIAAQSPEYQDALQDFAQRSAHIDALKTGLDFGKYATPGSVQVPDQAMVAGDPRALAMTRKGLYGLQRAVQNMDPNAVNLFRSGARQATIDAVNQVPATLRGSTNPVLNTVFENSPFAHDARSLMFDTPDMQQRFENLLGRERNMALTSSEFGGSDI